VVFERLVTRLAAAEPGLWVLKGGMALEVRLGDQARLTKDIDLGLREELIDPDAMHNRLIEALNARPETDFFDFRPTTLALLRADGAGHRTWRTRVDIFLALRAFGTVSLDISPRPHELDATETLNLPNSLDFADVKAGRIEVIDIGRHTAEKLHAISRDFGDRENSRVRDLIDIVLIHEHDLIDARTLPAHVRDVWAERDRTEAPQGPPTPPGTWAARFERMAAELAVPVDFRRALQVLTEVWPDAADTRGHPAEPP
jgi:hypothetical protein